MSNWPLSYGAQASRGLADGYLGFTAGTTVPLSVTASGTTHTNGTVVEIDAALAHDAWGLDLTVTHHAGAYQLLDILEGAATEDVLIDDIPIANTNTAQSAAWRIFFPIHVPKGARIAARTQASVASAVARLTVAYRTSAVPGLFYGRRVTTYGASTGASQGTLCDPGGSAHTKTRTSLGTITNPIRHLILMATPDTLAITANNRWLFDVEYGSGNTVLSQGHFLSAGATGDTPYPAVWEFFNVDIPASGNLSINIQGLGTTAGTRGLRFVGFGID